jgi:mycofactocin precursor peptide peptidase
VTHSATSLAGHTWTELGQRETTIVAVPLGSCEQHGPHLPLDTDTRIASHLADALATLRTEVLVAPPLTIGTSWEHAGFPGLLSIDRAAMVAVLVELARSADWAGGLVLVNGHGGNVAAAGEAAAIIRSEGRAILVWSPIVPGGDAHAGRTETSLLLAIAPDLVRRDRLERGGDASMGDVVRDGVQSVSPNGVLGDPRGASAEEGIELRDRLVRSLLDAFDAWLPAR